MNVLTIYHFKNIELNLYVCSFVMKWNEYKNIILDSINNFHFDPEITEIIK